MKKKELKNTYRVYQDLNTYNYNVVVSDEQYVDERNIIDDFYAEVGSEWYGYVVEDFFITQDEIEDNGYSMEQFSELSDEEVLDLLNDLFTEDDFLDFERGGGITKCESDEKDEIYSIEEDCFCDEEKGMSVQAAIHFKFTMMDGDIKAERAH